MRHGVKKVKIGRDKEHGISLLRNLAIGLIIHEKIETTKKRAAAVGPFVERLISIGKKKDKMNAIRHLEKLIQHPNSSKKILGELVKRYEKRDSGFTRSYKVGYRKGDTAEITQVELIA